MTGKCPYCNSERFVGEDGGVICDRCGATFLTEESMQDPATHSAPPFDPDSIWDAHDDAWAKENSGL